MKKAVRILLPFIITALALWFVFKDVELSALGDRLKNAQLLPVLPPFLLCVAIHLFFRTLRWRYLLPTSPQGSKASMRQLFDSMMLGNLATFIFPFRLGEFIRPLILSRWTSYSFPTAFVSVVLERFFDLATVLLSFAWIISTREVDPTIMKGAMTLATISGGLLVFLVMACLCPQFTQDTVSFVSRFLPEKLRHFVDHFTKDLIRGASVVKTPSRLLMVLLLTAGTWIFAWLQFYVMLYIFPWERSLEVSVGIGVIVALLIAAPSVPGFFGPFQAGCVAAFELFGYQDHADMTAYSLMVHLLTYVLIISIGFWLLRKHDLKLFDLKNAAAQGQESAAHL